jgi:hypothetical protein
VTGSGTVVLVGATVVLDVDPTVLEVEFSGAVVLDAG